MVKRVKFSRRADAAATSRSESRLAQRVLTDVRDEFVAGTQDKSVALNLHFGTGKQLSAAMFAWNRIIPEELKTKLLLWSLGLAPFDPAFAASIKRALRDAGTPPPGPGRSGSPSR